MLKLEPWLPFDLQGVAKISALNKEMHIGIEMVDKEMVGG